MEPTPELIDDIYLEKVLRARAEPPTEKILDGPRLFAYACAISRAGIRMQHPNASTDEVNEMLRQRIELAEKLAETSNG